MEGVGLHALHGYGHCSSNSVCRLGCNLLKDTECALHLLGKAFGFVGLV